MIYAQSSVVIERRAEEVFAFVTDPANERHWHTDVVEGDQISPGPVGVGTRFRWVMNFMGKRETSMRVTRYEPDALIELATEKPVLGLSPTIGYATEAVGQGTRFTRTLDMQFPRLLRFMDRISRRGVQGNNERFVQNLKKVLEN